MWNDACSWTRTRLPLMAGGELTGADRRKTERHLIGCPNCRDRLESCRGTVGLLRKIAGETGPSAEAPSLWPSLARQIRESRREQPMLVPWGLRPLAWVPALAAGLLLAVGAGVSWTWSRSGNMGEVVPAASSPTQVVQSPASPVKKPKSRLKSDAPTLAEGPRRDDERTAPEPPRPPARMVSVPVNPPRPAAEATH